MFKKKSWDLILSCFTLSVTIVLKKFILSLLLSYILPTAVFVRLFCVIFFSP